MIKQRQKVIRLADESELGWKVVDEYMQSEIASDEEDQKKIHRAQFRTRGKAKSDRGRRGRRYMPYRTRPAHPVETMSYQAYQTRQQPGYNNSSNSSSSKGLVFVSCVARPGTGKSTVRQLREVIKVKYKFIFFPEYKYGPFGRKVPVEHRNVGY